MFVRGSIDDTEEAGRRGTGLQVPVGTKLISSMVPE